MLQTQLGKDDGPSKFSRVVEYLLAELNGKRHVKIRVDDEEQLDSKRRFQLGCPNIIPRKLRRLIVQRLHLGPALVGSVD